MSKRTATIGIVIIGRNEGERLIRCLRSVRDAHCPVVYVDSASIDGSVQRALDFGALVVELNVEKPFTAARARAEGFAALERSRPNLRYVFFVDGDCEVEPNFLEEAERFLIANPDFAVVCGRRRERFPEASRFNFLIDREWATPVGEASACGGDALYRSEAYRAVGGFDPRMLAGEEPELCSRLLAIGWKIMRLGIPMTIHDAAMHRFSQWWRRSIRSGMGYAQAWAGTRRKEGPCLYEREIARAIAWAGLLPLVALGLELFVHPGLIFIWPGLVILQGLRLAFREGAIAASLSVISKFAELIGIIRYGLRALHGSTGTTVVYK